MAQTMDIRTRSKKNGAARDALKARASDVMDDFAELRKDMSRLADAAGKTARGEVRDAGQRLRNLGRQIADRAHTGADYVSAQVRNRPVAALGASLGAGLLIGLLLARR